MLFWLAFSVGGRVALLHSRREMQLLAPGCGAFVLVPMFVVFQLMPLGKCTTGSHPRFSRREREETVPVSRVKIPEDPRSWHE